MTPEQEDDLVAQFWTRADEDTISEAVRLAIRAAVAQESQWRESVLNELIAAHIYTKEHDTNPRKAIHDAITWHCQVALDPAVSSDAKKLVAQERERCAKAFETEAETWGEMRKKGYLGAIKRKGAAAIRRGTE